MSYLENRMKTNQIIKGDCIEEMKKLPDNSVDAIITDPPYKLQFKNPIDLHGRKAFYGSLQDMDWDKLNIKELYEKLFPQFNKILKKDGSILIFVRTEWITYCIDEAEKNGFKIKATITWHKTNPVPQVRKKNYLSSTESILWFSRWNEEKILFTFNFKKQKEMHNFVEFPICSGNERTKHPTQKPLKLMERLVHIHTNEGDTILDPFLGSGTTAIACLKLNRKFIGIEKEEEYVKIANARIKPFLEQKKL